MRKQIFLLTLALSLMCNLGAQAEYTSLTIKEVLTSQPTEPIMLKDVTVYYSTMGYLFVSDETGRLRIEKENYDFTAFKNGDVVDNIVGQFSIVMGNPVLAMSSMPSQAKSQGKAVAAKRMYDGNVTDQLLYQMVEYKGMPVFMKGAERTYLFDIDSVRLYDLFNLNPTYDEDMSYSIQAIVVMYDAKTACLAPIKVEACQGEPTDYYTSWEDYDYVKLDSVVWYDCDTIGTLERLRYDSLGTCIYHQFFYQQTATHTQMVEKFITPEYDANGTMLKSCIKIMEDGETTNEYTHYYHYDATGNLTAFYRINNSNDTLYGEEYNYTDTAIYVANYKHSNTLIYSLDSEGRVTGLSEIYKDEKYLYYTIRFDMDWQMAYLTIDGETETLDMEIDPNFPLNKAAGIYESIALNDDFFLSPGYRLFSMAGFYQKYLFYWSGANYPKASGIEDTRVPSIHQGSYDVLGRQVVPGSKGIVIENGRKVMNY